MKAVILNSGIGKRMGALTKSNPKCMCSIGKDHTIISWQLELIKKAGINEVVITTGPFSDKLEEHVSQYTHNAKFIHNKKYCETNYIYSMFLARDFLNDDILLLHGDLVLEDSIIEELVSAKTSVVSIDSSISLPEKDFKARMHDGRVVEIGVNIFGPDCVACQPAYKLLKKDMAEWMHAIEEFCIREETNVYAENALNTIFDRVTLYPLELNGRLCNEIDNPEDMATISRLFAEYTKKRDKEISE